MVSIESKWKKLNAHYSLKKFWFKMIFVLISDLLGNRAASRLACLVFVYELYKSEPVTLSPFAAVFVRALMPTTKSAEKSFITLLLTNSPLAKEAYR